MRSCLVACILIWFEYISCISLLLDVRQYDHVTTLFPLFLIFLRILSYSPLSPIEEYNELYKYFWLVKEVHLYFNLFTFHQASPSNPYQCSLFPRCAEAWQKHKLILWFLIQMTKCLLYVGLDFHQYNTRIACVSLLLLTFSSFSFYSRSSFIRTKDFDCQLRNQIWLNKFLFVLILCVFVWCNVIECLLFFFLCVNRTCILGLNQSTMEYVHKGSPTIAD